MNNSTIVHIPLEQLYHHPDNPRKDLGDLTELADSPVVKNDLGGIEMTDKYIPLVRQLREKESRDNRALLDAAADAIEALCNHYQNAIVPPVALGQTVYAAIRPVFSAEKPFVDEWQVCGIQFDGEKFYAVDRDFGVYEVGDDYCKLTRQEAEIVLGQGVKL